MPVNPPDGAPLDWVCARFADMTLTDLYASLQLRQLVFVVEQNCVYLDADGNDAEAWHLMGWNGAASRRELAAYARLYAPGVRHDEAVIGRVITHPDIRGRGVGVALMHEAFANVRALFGDTAIRISAQLHLEPFYRRLGFAIAGDPFVEDGIPHIAMLRAGGHAA